MSSTYNGNPASFPTSVTIPSDGDPIDAASVNAAFEGLADRTAWLKGKLGPAGNFRMQSGMAYADPNNWTPENAQIGQFFQLLALTNLYIPLELPHGCQLKQVTAYIKPEGGHGSLPTKPTFFVREVPVASFTYTDLATGTDPSATVMAYEAVHTVATSSFGHTVDRVNNRYIVVFVGETGGAFIAGLQFIGLLVNYDTVLVDPGAA